MSQMRDEVEQAAQTAVRGAMASCQQDQAAANTPSQGHYLACTHLLSASAAAAQALHDPSSICGMWLAVRTLQTFSTMAVSSLRALQTHQHPRI